MTHQLNNLLASSDAILNSIVFDMQRLVTPATYNGVLPPKYLPTTDAAQGLELLVTYIAELDVQSKYVAYKYQIPVSDPRWTEHEYGYISFGGQSGQTLLRAIVIASILAIQGGPK